MSEIVKNKKESLPKRAVNFFKLKSADVIARLNFFMVKDKNEDLLSRLSNKYRSDKGTKKVFAWEGARHLYSPIYHSYFEGLRNKEISIFEIGIGSGASIKVWYDYFPKANIYALDIVDYSHLDNNRIKTFKGDQSSRTDLEAIFKQINRPMDIIIDDGGHHMNQQQISFGCLFKFLKSGGLYFIEDLHTSYWPYNGFSVVYGDVPIDTNADKSNTTLKMIRDYIANKKLHSLFLTPEEMSYLDQSIADCRLYDTVVNEQGPDHVVMFKKK